MVKARAESIHANMCPGPDLHPVMNISISQWDENLMIGCMCN